MPRRSKTKLHPEEMDGEPAPPEPNLPVSYPAFTPKSGPSSPNRYATAFATTYCLFFLPVVASFVTVLVSYFVLGMFELLACGAGLYFCSWSFRWVFQRSETVLATRTWPQARAVVLYATKSVGMVPLSACVSFIIVDIAFGIFWGYVVAITLAFFFGSAANGSTFAPTQEPDLERGPRPGGIDDKRREEYEKAIRNQTGRR